MTTPTQTSLSLDDAGNGFRDADEEIWPIALRTEGKQPIVVLKMSRPLSKGKLWDIVRKAHADRLVVVVNADDLRADGLNISRRLSWERTAKDFFWQIASNPRYISLANCTNLIVRFGIDGAIHYTRGEGHVESRLYYDPAVAEDGFRDDCPGDMLGFTSTFVAALAAHIAKEGSLSVGEGVRDGLRSSRRLFRQGFGTNLAQLDYLGADIFQPADEKDAPIADVGVPNPTVSESAETKFWCILKDLSEARLEDIAYETVLCGEAATLKSVPIGRFGSLKTVDRAEIESFHSIRNLMREYLATATPKRPLSIAVFGPPGSGKSFGVIEVTKSITSGAIEPLEFNLSQFESPADLVSALHKVRDVVLSGKVPLVFFDEFDSPFNGKLGWLKYFLAPMQDGKFKDGETMHPIGKAIFVFAGGTCITYAQFSGEECDNKGAKAVNQGSQQPAQLTPGQGQAGREAEDAKQEFKDAKGPDFVSRLRGYVNILGPNPVGEGDNFFMIRRAMLLRAQLKHKAKQIFDGTDRAQIDLGVLRAFLKTSKYKHGARSMEAIIDMSLLAERKSFEQAALPPAEQLKLHVDAELFSRLVVRDVLFGGAREKLAKAIHEKYRRDQQGIKTADDPSMRAWEELAEDLKESNRQQADHIPEKLRQIRCGFSPVVGRKPVKIKLDEKEVEILAEMEHDRWVTERLRAGWSLGPRNPDKKTSPYLVGWHELTPDVQEYDNQTVRGMPDYMADAEFEIYRLD